MNQDRSLLYRVDLPCQFFNVKLLDVVDVGSKRLRILYDVNRSSDFVNTSIVNHC